MKIARTIDIAKSLSNHSTHQFHIGAVITAGNRVLSTGFNQIRHLKIGKKFTNFDCSLHAERNACSKVNKKKLKGATITLYRELKDGTPADSFPCEQCMYLLVEMGIKKIISSCSEYPYYKVVKI